MSPKPFIQVKTGGGPREMGVDFGRATGELLKVFLADSRRFYARHSRHDMDYARRFAMRNYYVPTAKAYPAYMEEIRGIAEGARVPFEDLFLLTADEEVSSLWSRPAGARASVSAKEKCSSAAVWTKAGMRVLHNEDYPERYLGRLVICQAEPAGAPAFLAVTYPYLLAGPSCGLNSASLAFAVDSLRFPTLRRGVLSNFVQRDLYAACGIEDAARRMSADSVTASASALVATRHGDARMVEVTTRGRGVKHIGRSRYLTHTNHCRTDGPDRRHERATLGSRMRLAVLEHHLSGRAADATSAQLQAALSAPELAALRDPRDPNASVTLASCVIDLAGRSVAVAKRGPGGHGFRRYYLRPRRGR